LTTIDKPRSRGLAVAGRGRESPRTGLAPDQSHCRGCRQHSASPSAAPRHARRAAQQGDASSVVTPWHEMTNDRHRRHDTKRSVSVFLGVREPEVERPIVIGLL